MRTNKDLLVKGLKFIAYTVALMFTAPVIVYEAFKNENHPWFLPVFIVGIILGIGAIVMGFYSIKVIMDSLFGSKKKIE